MEIKKNVYITVSVVTEQLFNRLEELSSFRCALPANIPRASTTLKMHATLERMVR